MFLPLSNMQCCWWNTQGINHIHTVLTIGTFQHTCAVDIRQELFSLTLLLVRKYTMVKETIIYANVELRLYIFCKSEWADSKLIKLGITYIDISEMNTCSQ